jgi:plasmid stabilization system protein ParE
MGFRILLSRRSLTDLREIFAYIAGQNVAAAERIVQALADRTKTLRAFPRIGTRVRKRPAIRRLYHSPYVIYYRVDAARRVVEVLHFWDGRRLPPPL